MMRSLLSKKVVLGATLCALAMGMFATTSSARIVRGRKIPYFLYGAGIFGNRSAFAGNFGSAKFYKFTGSDVVLGTASGRVTNRSGRPQLFLNEGNAVEDPQNGFLYPSTGDIQAIAARRGRNRARSQILLSYNPRFAN